MFLSNISQALLKDCLNLLAKQVFEARVKFYVILVQVTKELICPQHLGNADQLVQEKKRIKQTRKTYKLEM